MTELIDLTPKPALGSELPPTDFNVSRDFQDLINMPGNEAVDLTLEPDKTVELGTEVISPIGENGVKALAYIEFPSNLRENGRLMIGEHPEKGFFIAGPKSDSSKLDKSTHDLINTSKIPLELGRSDVRFEVGRQGIVLKDSIKGDFKIPPIMTKTLSSEFGALSSRKHLNVEVKDGKVFITDLSSGGTKLVKHK